MCKSPEITNKTACEAQYIRCVDKISERPEMAGESKETIALLLSQDGKTRKRLCK